jgi:hypothetical protein
MVAVAGMRCRCTQDQPTEAGRDDKGSAVISDRIDEYAGLRRELEVGLRLAPTVASAASAAKSVAAILDAGPAVPVRLAGLSLEGSRVHITIGVILGSVDAIKTAEPEARAAVALLARIVADLAPYDPAFVTLPHPTSFEAAAAARAAREEKLVATVDRLVAIG